MTKPELDLKALREKAEAATPGTWEYDRRWMGCNAPIFSGTVQLYVDGEDAEFIAAANPTTVLALLDRIEELDELLESTNDVMCELNDGCVEQRKRIAELEAERAANHTRLAAADKRDAEMVARVEELENGLREVLNAFDERALPPPWKSDSARIAELRKLVESADGRCRLHFLDSDRWARCNQPRLHNGECR